MANISILAINQTAIIMDVNVFECDKDDSTLFTIIDEVQFFEYPHCNGQGFSDFYLRPMDTVLMKTQFYVKQGTEDDPITLRNITVGINAVRQSEVEQFPLESFSINTSGYLPNGDNVQEIEFSQDRDFIIPTGDCRNQIQLTRRPTLDLTVAPLPGTVGTTEYFSAYELIYPFKVRWEEWRTLPGANRAFPTPTQNWRVYPDVAGWSINVDIQAQVHDASTDHVTDFTHIVWGTFTDPCDQPYSVEFNTYDSTGVNTYEEVLATDADTFVEATITGDFSGYTADQLYGILSLDAWGIGGTAFVQEIGTRIVVENEFVWYGTNDVATLTKVSNSRITVTAWIDHELIPSGTNQFIISVLVGEYHLGASSSGATCLNNVFIDIFTCGELEIIEVTDANTFIVSGSVVTQELRSVYVEEMILTFITATTWSISGGYIDGMPISTGSVGGNVISAPVHPYTNAIVGDTIQGDITGTTYSSTDTINGIGDMQIGCSFFVS